MKACRHAMTLYENGELSPLLFLLARALMEKEEHRKRKLLGNLHKRNCKRLRRLMEDECGGVSASKKEMARLLEFATGAWHGGQLLCLAAAEYLFDDSKLYKGQGDALFYHVEEGALYVAEVKTWDGPVRDFRKVRKAVEQATRHAKRLESYLKHLVAVEPADEKEMKGIMATLPVKAAVVLPVTREDSRESASGGDVNGGTVMYELQQHLQLRIGAEKMTLAKEVTRIEPRRRESSMISSHRTRHGR